MKKETQVLKGNVLKKKDLYVFLLLPYFSGG